MALAILLLFRKMLQGDRVLEPSHLMKADGEMLCLSVFFSLILTYIVHPEHLTTNPLIRIIGYNNPCVPWDIPPAIYFASVFFGFGTYCCVRFAITDAQRAELDQKESLAKKRFTYVANIIYVISRLCTNLIFVAAPSMEDVGQTRLHSFFFLQYITCRWLAVLAHFVVAERLTISQCIFIIVYTFVSIVMPILLFVQIYFWTPGLPNYTDWSGDPENGVLIHPLIVMTVDYGWFLCLPFTAICTPWGRPLHVTTCLGEIGDADYEPKALEGSEE
jgi:hypothetical protein